MPAPRLSALVLRAHDPSKMDQKKYDGAPHFFHFNSVQTKLSLQSSEFLLTKDREIADDVHHIISFLVFCSRFVLLLYFFSQVDLDAHTFIRDVYLKKSKFI
jgi:hypothetical protein